MATRIRKYAAMPLPLLITNTQGPPVLAPYGFVGTRAQTPEVYNVGLTSGLTARNASFMRDSVSQIKFAWANWIMNHQFVAGNTLTLKASVEYPAGTFTQVTFGGSATGVVAAGGLLESDFVAVNIPDGAQFWTRCYAVWSVGALTSLTQANATLGEASVYPGTDQTMSGTITSTGYALCQPCMIVGRTAKKNVLIIGDSLQSATGSMTNPNGAYAQLPNALNDYAWAVMPMPGLRASQFLSGVGAEQDTIASYPTDIVSGFGMNDFGEPVSAATLLARQETIRQRYLSKVFHLATVNANTTSTDSWATLGNQTVQSFEAAKVTYNTAVRAGIAGYGSFYECAGVTETALNSGKWKSDGTAFKYTVDGVHPSVYAALQYAAAHFTL